MKVFTISEETNIQNGENIENINLFLQYFIHPNRERQNEFEECLKKNVNNNYITKIYLLNEKIYSDEDLGVSSDKIIQINIQNRLKFKDVFEYINTHNIKGYNVIVNSDIFLDETICNLFKSDIHINKKMYALLRYEYNLREPEKTYLFGPRGDSQDTWIIHSNFNISKKECKIFNFEFGIPGCDNKMTYLMSTLGYDVINDPYFIKTFHIHESNIRNYTNKDRILPPYEIVMPKKSFEILVNSNPDLSIYFDLKYNHKNSNDKLFKYINSKFEKNENFIIPRVSTIETNFAILPLVLNNSELENFFQMYKNTMKNNAGIKISSIKSIKKYSKLYLEAFENCELYGSWAPFDAVYNCTKESITLLDNMFKTKDTIYSEVFDVYHYLYNTAWTFALKDKRILMVSNFEESIKEKINNRKEIYGIDLFPNCEIITIKPPQTQGSEDSDEFDIELNRFIKKLDKIKDNYDIALVSCGGYGSLVCNHIYKSGKSAIYVGGVLQMYWGILGNRWFNNRPDIIRLYLNKMWTRAKESEKPKNYKGIENSCYW